MAEKLFPAFLLASAAAAGVMYYQKSTYAGDELNFIFRIRQEGKLVKFSRWGFLSYHFYFLCISFTQDFSIRFRLDNHFLLGLSVSPQSHNNFTHQNNSHILVGTRCHQSDSVRDFSRGLQDFDANPPLQKEEKISKVDTQSIDTPKIT